MSNKIKISYEQLYQDIDSLADSIISSDAIYSSVYAIPRGGVPIAFLLAERLGLEVVDKIEPNSLVVDDLIDSGTTLKKYSGYDIAVLYAKPYSPRTVTRYREAVYDGWIEFPYEDTNADIEENFIRILEHLGEDPTREGLLETPKRYIKFLKEFTTVPEFNFTAFDAEDTDEMIIQKDIPFFSLCEHHMAPFFGKATVAYIPDGKIVGLSKLARTVELYSHKLQNQERITSQIVKRLKEELNPKGVAVTLSARHLCMEMRGVRTHDVHTVTTKLDGAFKDNHDTRAEFMNTVT